MMEVMDNGGGAAASETLLLEVVGPRLLQYVLDLDETSITGYFQGSPLGEPREAVLRELALLLGQLIPEPDADPFLRQMQLDVLGTYDPQGETSYINTLRVRCGGSISAGTASDPVVAHLLPVARDMYPLFLLPPPPEPAFNAFAPSMARSLFHHPGKALFEGAVMDDPELSRLFSEQSEHAGRSGQFMSSAGRGGGIQLAMFADLLIRSSWSWLKLDSEAPGLDDFLAATATSVDRIRDAVMGRAVSVPVRIGLAGVKLPANASPVILPWGEMRASRELDREMVPSSIVGALSTTTAEGVQIVIDYSGDVVVETEIPYQIEIGQHDIHAGWPPHLRGFEVIQRRIESIQLGLLLAISDHPQPMVVLAWQRTLDPLSQGSGVSWSDTRRTPNLVPYQLAADGLNDWAHWIADVDTRRVASVEVAIRRTIRAAVERSDPSDALVDAVIAWENLVGSREGEPTLRVTAALAWLLEDDPGNRRTRQTALKKLYNLRSDVVHGNRPLDGPEAVQGSRDARSVAVDALRKLFRDRPELLQECGDGSERSLRLMLGKATPPTQP
jgi:hypothetical protein